MADQQTLDVYDARVEEYRDMVKAHSNDPMLSRFIAAVKPGGTVLDFGCGPGVASGVFKDHGFEVDAMDGSKEMVRFANEAFDVGARVVLFEEFSELEHYDGIWANFSLLHAPEEDFPHLLETLHTALRSDGVLQLGMKLGSGSHRDSLGRFYAYYSEEELTDHLTVTGFEVEWAKPGKGGGLSGNVEPWLQLLSRKL